MPEPEYNGGLTEVGDSDGNVIINNKVIIYWTHIQVRLITKRQKVTCGCETCIFANSLHASFLSRMDEGSNLIFWYQLMVCPLVPFRTSKRLRVFSMG